MSTKKEAEKIGRALLKQLGPGWKMELVENLGWHSRAYKDGVKVHTNIDWLTRKPRSYTAFIGRADGLGGIWAESGRTPKAAIRNTLRKAKEELDYKNEVFAAGVVATKTLGIRL